MTAAFDGVPVVQFLADGRTVKLVQPFGFRDPAGVAWPVPAGTVVDGASIPRPLWALIGGPFEGKYRDASIVHDWYCDLKSRPWRAVHRVFYDGMIASGVGVPEAKLLYYSVFRFGPRWTVPGDPTESAVAPPAPYNSAEVAAADGAIRAADPSLEEIERMALARPGAQPGFLKR